MDLRPLLRPGALVIAFLFAAVAVVDLVDSLRATAKSTPRLLRADNVFFVAQDRSVERPLDAEENLIVDVEGESIEIRSSGELKVDFTMDARIDAMILDYIFTSGGGVASVAVVREPTTPGGSPVEISRQLSSTSGRRGRVRFPLHGHKGDLALVVDVALNEPSAGLHFSSMRLIEEN